MTTDSFTDDVMMAPHTRNWQLVRHTESALRTGNESLGNVPALLRSLLDEQAWREFVLPSGETVAYKRFAEFVRAQPPRGLGADMDVMRRIAGSDDPDLLRLLRDADKVGRGPGPGNKPKIDGDSPAMLGDDQTGVTAARLERDYPEQYAAVQSGELTINAAAVQTGIRPKRASITGSSTGSAAKTIVRQLGHDYARELIDDLIRELESTDTEEPNRRPHRLHRHQRPRPK